MVSFENQTQSELQNAQGMAKPQSGLHIPLNPLMEKSPGGAMRAVIIYYFEFLSKFKRVINSQC